MGGVVYLFWAQGVGGTKVMQPAQFPCPTCMSSIAKSYHEIWILAPDQPWKCHNLCYGCLRSASPDVRRQDSQWAEYRALLNSEVAHMLELAHGVGFSAEQICIRKKRTRQLRE